MYEGLNSRPLIVGSERLPRFRERAVEVLKSRVTSQCRTLEACPPCTAAAQRTEETVPCRGLPNDSTEGRRSVRRLAIVAVLSLVVLGLGLGACGAVVASAFGGAAGTSGQPAGGPGGPAGESGGGAATDGLAVPASWVTLERGAAATCPGLGWSLLGAIGRVESDSGRSRFPGVTSGANAYGAEGPMQFEQATFEEYAVVGPGGATPASPYDPVDAVYTAARMLCANGAATPSGVFGAVFDYDHSVLYVETVLVLARAFADDPSLDSVPASALAFAAAQLGTPYVWGGESSGGYDCSGLVQASYRSVGVELPRVAQTQYDAGPLLRPRAAVEPGDLIFFGSGPTGVSHVGMYVGSGDMIDAPHTGTVVRVQRAPLSSGASWGSEVVVGETRPSAA